MTLSVLWMSPDSETAAAAQTALDRRNSAVSIRHAASLYDAEVMLNRDSFRLIIASYRMPDGEGSAISGKSFSPVIVYEAEENIRHGLDAVRKGAFDYRTFAPALMDDLPEIVESTLTAWGKAEERCLKGRWRSFFSDASGEAAFMARFPSGECVETNTGFRRMFGLSDEKAEGFILWEVFHPDFLSEMMRQMNRDVVRPDFQRAAFQLSGVSLFEGEILTVPFEWNGKRFFQGVIRDLSSFLSLHEKLRHVSKIEALGALAGGIAHEFNNQMQTVSGFAEIMLFTMGKDENVKKRLTAICEAGRRATELTRQIQLFGQKAEKQFRPLDLNEEVSYHIKLLKKVLPPKIELVSHLAPEAPTIDGDPALISHLATRLGICALTALPGGGRFSVETRRVSYTGSDPAADAEIPPGDYAVLGFCFVSDSGEGVRPLFPDSDAAPASSSLNPNLTYSMIQEIARDHHARIRWFDGDSGSRAVKLFFPVPTPETAEAEPAAPPPEGKGETLLIVDDDAVNRRLLADFLAGKGYRTVEAADGTEALNQSERQGKVDLVILGFPLPGMSGPECLDRLKYGQPDCGVIGVIACASIGAGDEVLAAGADHFLEKPFSLNRALNLIRETLDARLPPG